MMEKDEYLRIISGRGGRYGEDGGLLDLLAWCNKSSLIQVTLDEARRFCENPNAPYYLDPESIDK